MKRRVLHCIPTMEGGGAERQLTYLCQGLTELGWHSHVALFHEGPNIARLRKSGAIIHLLPSYGHHDPLNVWRFVRLIRRIRPTVVQSWLPMMNTIGGIACRILGTPHIISERTARVAHDKTWKNGLRRVVARHAAAVVSNSIDGDAYWQELLTNGAPRFIIPNALPLAEIDSTQAISYSEIGTAPDRPIILYAGRFDVPKNLETMVEAFFQVVCQSNAVAILMGAGPQKPKLERMIRERGLSDRVDLRGYQSNVWAWMKRASLVVSMSLYEGMPNTVMEAMACGSPLVVSDIPQHRAILDESSACLVDPTSAQEIASAIDNAITDQPGARRRAERARVSCVNWSLQNMARGYEKAYLAIGEGPR